MQKVKYDVNQPNIDILIIENALRKNRNLKIMVGAILVCLAICIIISALDTLPTKFAFTLALVCMLFGFSGIYFLLSALLRYDTQKNYVLKIMTQRPDMVAWVYYYKVQSLPFGIKVFEYSTLYIHLLNQEKINIRMPEWEIKFLINLLQERLQHTTFGYSKYKQQLFNIAPDLLKKD
ncbi:MAG: hypothetical protein ACPG49_08865 [Chitinophagales bacterium]